MSKQMTLAQIKSHCMQADERLVDEVVNIHSLSMSPQHPGMVVIKRGEHATANVHRMQSHVYRTTSRVLLDLPGGYLEKCAEKAPELAAQNFNHWVAQSKPKEVLVRMQRQEDGELQVRAMLPASWYPIPYAQTVQSMINRFGPDMIAHKFTCDEYLYIDLVNGELQKQAVVGDIIKTGLRIEDSDCGFGNLRMLPFSLRLRCTNGATSMDTGAIMSIGHTAKEAADSNRVFARVESGIGLMAAYANRLADLVERSHKIKVDNVKEVMDRLNKRFMVTKLEAKAAIQGYEEEADLGHTIYRIAQGYTRGANNEELKERASVNRLQAVGGTVLELSDSSSFKWN